MKLSLCKNRISKPETGFQKTGNEDFPKKWKLGIPKPQKIKSTQ